MAVVLPPKPVWNQLIKSGCCVFVGGNASVPYALIQDLIDHSTGFSDIEMVHMLALGDTRWAKEQHRQLFKVNTFFIGGEEVRRVARLGGARAAAHFFLRPGQPGHIFFPRSLGLPFFPASSLPGFFLVHGTKRAGR